MAIDSATASELIDIVRRAAKAEILPRFRNLDPESIQTKTSQEDLVTIADQRAEAFIQREVAERFPEATIIGEEATSADASILDRIAEAEMAVIIDPIDGTWNFARNLTQFGVILAVASRGETVFGLLYDPVMDDWIMAHRGQGAFYVRPDGTERQLKVSERENLAEMTGFTSLRLFPKELQYRLAATFPDFSRMMSIGCACHEYRTLASAFGEFSLIGALMPWDHAAGVLVHQEAGGYSALLDGRPYQPTIHQGRLLLANSRDTWEQLRERFAFMV
ncbi:inositol monophosphatase [Halomonas sp. McH1-25]|uniref:inositol monophosphatase family protein n=1 Tax=unclassified Halomonas TaxID=2609666 RepID=UPI001EF5F6DB|nr:MULTISPECIES: inositol monophosphatase family protein [unclassified Halomonas]MCG7599702.1 inositol monophosphatase [Halomonas sp. McH1-25]MCP1342786.1 inositol monophosphatase [Halomonas sp. FL8]MCP1360856.1 inositol monophosphatase [Halomonas sp. BBD45]